MCKPVDSQINSVFDSRAAEFAPDRIGPCGRRCSECQIAALLANLPIAPSRNRAPSARELVRA